MEVLCKNVIKKFTILKIRQKIGYSAFIKNMTVNELILKTIYDVYKFRKREGLISNPWPEIQHKIVDDIATGNSPIGDINKVYDDLFGESDSTCDENLVKDDFKIPAIRNEDNYSLKCNQKYIIAALDKNKCDELFKEILQKADQ